MELKRKEIKDITFTYFTRHDHSSLDNFIDRIKANINKRKIVTNLYNEIINAWINFDTVNDFNNWFDDRWLQISVIERSSLYENISLWMIVNGFGQPDSLRIDGEKFDDGYTPAKAMGEENYKEFKYLTDYVKNDKRAFDAFEAELNRHHDEITTLYDDVEGTYFMIECLFEEFKKEIENSARTANEKERVLNELIIKIRTPATKWKDEYFEEFELIHKSNKYSDIRNKIIPSYVGRFNRFDSLQFSFVILCHVYKNNQHFLSCFNGRKLEIENLSQEDPCINTFLNARKSRKKRGLKK